MRFPIFTLHAAYITYIISVTLFISGSLSVLLYEVDRQNRDAYVINDAARQRHLSQRIAKLSLYIQNDVEHSNAIDDVKVDTLKQLVNRWQSAYSSLPVTSQLIDSLLKRNGVYQNKIITACEDIISSPGSLLVNEAVKVISEYEQPFLWGMEKIVLTYQLEAEEKLSLLKRILYFIAATAVLLITGGFTWLFLPVTNRLSASNKSLEQLKNYLQLKERQYRELVEVSRDMIYEINNKGKYVYVNPVLESITGYSKEELYTKHYSELILPEHRDEVIKFYKEQREQNQESSYLEFPISGRKNNVVWIGQNVNIISTEDGTWKALVIARDITDLKDTQQKLEENEKLYSLLLKNSHDLVALHDPDGTFKYLSPAVKAMLGYDEEELIDTLAIDLAHPDDRPMLLKALQEDTTTGQPRSNLVFRLKHKQGHYVWGEVSAVPIKDEKQKVKFILTSNRDVTKRMHLEQKLLDSEMLFRSLSENATVGVFRTDPLGNCTYVNARWSYIAGFTNEQAQSGGWMSAIHEEDKPKVVEEWIASIKEDREFSLEYRFIGSGKIFWVQGGSSKYTDSVGNILGYVGTINNITERKVAEKKLFESEELYRLLSENSRDMISLHQPDGTYVFVSASVKELLGFMPGELIDTSPYELIHPDDHKRLQEGPHQNLRKGIGATNIEYRVKKKDGTYIWMNAYTHPVLDCEGNLTSFQTSSRDISAQKEYEFALLAEKQRAEDATKVKSDFLSMMIREKADRLRAALTGHYSARRR